MIPQFRRDKRGAILLASLLFLLLLCFTWSLLDAQSSSLLSLPLSLPLLQSSSSSSPHTTTTTTTHKIDSRPDQITCPAPLGGRGQSRRFPLLLRDRNATAAVHGDTIVLPKVVAIVFYGRRATVSILDCYLKRNLVTNGGLIDEVIWLRRTEDVVDLKLLHRLLHSEPRYSMRDVDRTESRSFASAYDNLDDETLYIKIDDDVVFIDDSALLSVICTKLSHPEYYIVSANVVNQPMMSWLHWNLDAVRPYLPDTLHPYPQPAEGEHVDWRASKLPDYDGPPDLDWRAWDPPVDGSLHRWLPLRHHHRPRPDDGDDDDDDDTLARTPIAHTEYAAFGRGLAHWQIAAQQHYSLLENLEAGALHRYMFNVWDFKLRRVGIQFMAVAGRDINRAKPIDGDDEEHFAVTMPRRLGRAAVADGRAVVAHYSFNPQSVKMPTTDVLDRYRSYAREMVCAGPMLWTPEMGEES